MKFIFIFPIKLYQWVISPLIGRNCRFTPTCSAYMIEAVEKHGIIKGLPMGLKRIGKCHPCSNHYEETKGYDPVPPKTDKT